MTRLLKYIVIINLCLFIVTMAGSWWIARSVGTSAYLAGAAAAWVVGLSASLALFVSFIYSRKSKQENAVTGTLLAMLVRMGLPICAIVLVMSQSDSLLRDSGFMGLLTMNYLIALPLETAMSLVFARVESEAT